MGQTAKFFVMTGLIVASTLAGYLARRRGWVSENAARWLMTAVVVFGYSPVSFLSIWSIQPKAQDVWLPVFGGLQVLIMAGLGVAAGRMLTRDRQDYGLLGMLSAVGNTGFTMGGFVIYIVFGLEGLGRGSIYALMWYPMVVLVLYPMGQHFSGSHQGSLAALMTKSLFNWRSAGLPISLIGLTLTLSGVPYPKAVVESWHVVPIIMYIVLPTAYFSIGLRLHVSSLGAMKRLIAALMALRFVAAPALGFAMLALSGLTAHPLTGASRGVLLINSCVPTAITAVAVANMFHLRPRNASILFVCNSLVYLAVVLPVVLWLFAGGEME